MSKHWDPAWKTNSVLYRGSPTVEQLEASVEQSEALGLEIPDVDLTPCESEAGLIRMATVGPDYTVQIRAKERARAASLQEQLGRLAFYFICTRPRVWADQAHCKLNGGELTLVLRTVLDDGSEETLRWAGAAPPGVEAVRFDSGGRMMVLITDEGDEVEQDVSLIAQALMASEPFEPSPFDLLVHYIGRARGAIRETCALDRLEQHDKYQAVMEQTLELHPNRDVWLVLASGTTINLMAGGRGPTVSKEELEREDDRTREMLKEADRIDITEALLINYFKPELNTQHVSELSLKAKVLKKCYRAGLTGLMLAFSSADHRVAMYTDHIPPRLHHTMKVCL